MNQRTLGAPVPDGSLEQLFTQVYDELRRLAHRQRCTRDGLTLNTTSLVHELYLQLARGQVRFEQSRQFFAYAARAMRHLLIDRARERGRLRHGGERRRVELSESLADPSTIDDGRLLELDDALRKLAREDARAAEIVELHYFAGLSMEQIASILQCSQRTVYRDWRYARAYLHTVLAD